MRPSEFITLVNGAILKWSGLAAVFLAGVLSIAMLSTSYSGEAKKKPIHIGVIAFSEPRLRTHLDQSLIRGLREQGYIEGVNLTIEWRYADGDRGRVPQAAKDLAGMKLDAIVTTCTPSTRAMVAAAPKTPIVMAGASAALNAPEFWFDEPSLRKAYRATLAGLADPIIAGTVIEPRFFDFDFRMQLYDKSPICQLCKNEIHSFEDSTVDHVAPYSKGGKTIPSNGQLAHRGCNASKNAKIIDSAATA